MLVIKHYVERDGAELELTIEGDAERGQAARFRGHPDTWTPDDGEGAWIERVLLDGVEWAGKLTDDERAEAESLLLEEMRERYRAAAEDAAVARYESRGDW